MGCAARGAAHQLALAKGEFEHYIGARARVVCELVLWVYVAREQVGTEANREKPPLRRGDPLLVEGRPRLIIGWDEELDLHLLELARTENEIARRDLVAKSLSNLRDTEWRLYAAGGDNVAEVGEDALRRLRPEVSDGRGVGHRADVGLEHQVELAWRRERAGVTRFWRGDEVLLLRGRLREVLERRKRERALRFGFLLHLERALLCLLLVGRVAIQR